MTEGKGWHGESDRHRDVQRKDVPEPMRTPMQKSIPIALYHGTTKEGAESLISEGVKLDKLQERDMGFFGEGFYVSTSRKSSYGRSVVEIHLKPDIKYLDLRGDIKEGTVIPIKAGIWHKNFISDLKKKVIENRKYWKDEWADYYTPNTEKFDRLGYYQTVTRWAKDTGYDVILWIDHEIIILNPESIESITRPKRRV